MSKIICIHTPLKPKQYVHHVTRVRDCVMTSRRHMTVAAQLRGERHGGVERITRNVYIPFTVSFLILLRFYSNRAHLLQRTREAGECAVLAAFY